MKRIPIHWRTVDRGRVRIAGCLRVLCLMFWLLVPVTAMAQGTPAAGPPGLMDAPVFFETSYPTYTDDANLQLLPTGRVRLEPLGTERVHNFDWQRHRRKDLSWWMRIENFQYLLPLLASDRPENRRFVRSWFKSWYDTHRLNSPPNPAAWDGMTVGIRVLVFVWMLKEEVTAASPDIELIRMLRESIERHQRVLATPEKFDHNSNHGMWEAIGLFETTRVASSDRMTALALERLFALVEHSVSKQGVHKEHSPVYHFRFLKWLSSYVEYFRTLDGFSWAGLDKLSAIEQRMRRASYFLCDAHGDLPQIGDTDEGAASAELGSKVPAVNGRVLFDKEAGYAVYKDPEGSSGERYVVFCVQNQEYPPSFPHHFHNDALAVYYSCDGEVILGDAGRYSYDRSDVRGYLMSQAAHNTILPVSWVVPKSPGIFLAENVWMRGSESADSGDANVVFGARGSNGLLSRQVVIPRDGRHMAIRDTIRAGSASLSLWTRNAGADASRTFEVSSTYLALWHIGSDVETIEEVGRSTRSGRRVYRWRLLTRAKRRLELRIEIGGGNESLDQEVRLVRGERNPFLGWHSPAYKVLEPASLIVLKLTPAGKQLDVVTAIIESGDAP